MPELIDKNALQEALREEYDRHKALYDEIGHIERGGIVQGLSYAKMILCKQPTIEAEPVRRGRWIEAAKHRDENGTILTDYECSECFSLLKDSYPEEIEEERFCYNCGARMGE